MRRCVVVYLSPNYDMIIPPSTQILPEKDKSAPLSSHLNNGQSKSNKKEPRRNSRLPSHVIAIPAAQKAHQARHVARHARAAQQDQVFRVLLDRLAFLRAFLLAELFVDEVPLEAKKRNVNQRFIQTDFDRQDR